MTTAAQRTFNATPWARKPQHLKMQTVTAKLVTACPLCSVRIKPGQRTAIHYDTGDWAHVGCVVRRMNEKARDRELDLQLP